jgi:hypothetical protein
MPLAGIRYGLGQGEQTKYSSDDVARDVGHRALSSAALRLLLGSIRR